MQEFNQNNNDPVETQLDYQPEFVPEPTPPTPKKISLSLCLVLIIAITVFSVLFTLALSVTYYKSEINKIKAEKPGQQLLDECGFSELEYLDRLFREDYYDYDKLDQDELKSALLKAYVAATGDPYAEYYTPEEFAAFLSDNVGDNVGIGISVINTSVDVNGQTYNSFQVVSVFENSPAFGNVRAGDHIVYISDGENKLSVGELGYSEALSRLRGAAGTHATFGAFRKASTKSNEYQLIDFDIQRAEYKTQSVYYSVCGLDNSVGIVRINEFDLTTPEQFSKAVDSLLDEKCGYFVFDIRNNPGGDLKSIEAVLSYFLKKGDLMISVEDKYGNVSEDFVDVYRGQGDYTGCSVNKSDIGKYKDLKCVVITNGYTASAAELFTATMRDYGIAEIVGTTTYGKGCLQSFFATDKYGIPGGLKLTTALYFSKSHTSYHGTGIIPDHQIELSDEAADYNISLLPEELDNQLKKAIEILK